MVLWEEEKYETYKQDTLSLSNARLSRLNHYRPKMEEILQNCIVTSSNIISSAICLHELMRFDLNF